MVTSETLENVHGVGRVQQPAQAAECTTYTSFSAEHELPAEKTVHTKTFVHIGSSSRDPMQRLTV